jgi:hypothetical protein
MVAETYHPCQRETPGLQAYHFDRELHRVVLTFASMFTSVRVAASEDYTLSKAKPASPAGRRASQLPFTMYQ